MRHLSGREVVRLKGVPARPNEIDALVGRSGGEPLTSNSTELSQRSDAKFNVELRIPTLSVGTSSKRTSLVRLKGVEPLTLSSVG